MNNRITIKHDLLLDYTGKSFYPRTEERTLADAKIFYLLKRNNDQFVKRFIELHIID